MSKPDFKVVPAIEHYWMQYFRLCEMQYGYSPGRTDKTVLVSDDEDAIVAGCTIVATDGPYVFANGVVIATHISREFQYNAAVFIQDELQKLSATLNRTVMMLTSHPALIRIVEKHGFTRLPAELWYYSLGSTYVQPEFVVKRDTNLQLIEEDDAEDWLSDNQEVDSVQEEQKPPKRGPGRPKGSKNKKKK